MNLSSFRRSIERIIVFVLENNSEIAEENAKTHGVTLSIIQNIPNIIEVFPIYKNIISKLVSNCFPIQKNNINSLTHLERVTVIEAMRFDTPSKENFLKDIRKIENLSKFLEGMTLHGQAADLETKFVVEDPTILIDKEINKISIGLHDIDELMLGGLAMGEMCVIAGRPSFGKTSLAINIVSRFLKRDRNSSCIFYSLEMTATQIWRRYLCNLFGTEQNKINDIISNQKCMKEASNFKLKVINSLSSIEDIVEDINKTSVISNLGLVVLDHAQLIESSVQGIQNTNKVYEITKITRMLKQTANYLRLPIILLSQLSRDIDRRFDRTPRLSDMRDSGSIEQDADIILVITKPSYDEIDKKFSHSYESLLKINVLKNRSGKVGTQMVNFDKDRLLFSNILEE